MRPSVSRTNKIGEFQKKEFDKSPPEVKDVNFQSLEIDQRHKNQWRNTVWKTVTGPWYEQWRVLSWRRAISSWLAAVYPGDRATPHCSCWCG